MLKLGDMHLRNLSLFDDVRFDWGIEGTTVIKGLNLNSKAKGKSNGAGKTFLASRLPDMLGFAHPSITLGKAKTKRDAFYRKGASSQLLWSDGTIQTDVTKKLHGAGIRYDITQGEEVKFKNGLATAAEEWLDNAVPWTQAQFFNTIYLDNKNSSRAVFGSGADRFNLFDQLFTLDGYDAIKEHFVIVKASIRDDRAKLDMLQAQDAGLKRELEAALALTFKKAQDSYYFEEDVDVMVAKRDHLVALQNRISMATLSISKSGKSSVKFDSKLQSQLLKERDSLERSLDGHEAFTEWETGNREAQQRLKAIDKKIEETKGKCPVKPKLKDLGALSKQLSGVEQQLETMAEQEAVYENYQSHVKPLLEKFGKLSKPDRKVEAIDKDIRKAEGKLDVATEKQEQMEQVSEGKCPTCGSKFNPKHIAKHLKELGEQVTTLNGKLRILKIERVAVVGYDKLRAQIKELPKADKPDTKEKHALVTTSAALGLLVKLVRAKAKVELEPKPSGAKLLDKPKLSVKRLAEVKEQLHALAIAQQQTPISVILSSNGFKDKQALVDAEKEVANYDLSKLRLDIDTLTSAFSTIKRLRANLKELRPKIKTLSKSVEQAAMIDAIISAYSNAGLKRLAAHDIAKRVEANINDVAPNVFDEGFKFYFDVTPTDFHIRYEDKRGLFDVRVLSGAESGCFNILTMLGVLPELPSRLRANVMVLDELDANLDAPGQRMFCNQLMPILAESIPHLVIVTPKDSVYPNSRTCRVVKKGLTSNLIWE